MRPQINDRGTGPTPLPPTVRRAVSRQIFSHRSEEFSLLLRSVTGKLTQLLESNARCLVFTSSGTGGLEATVSNLLGPGDQVLALSCGYYGDLFAQLASERTGRPVDCLRAVDGSAVDPALVRERLRETRYRAVLITHAESSTGVLQPLRALSQVVRENSDALVLVDAIGSAGATPVLADEWGLDAVVIAPQKALMGPPGLCLVAVSERAMRAASEVRPAPFYFSFQRAAQALVAGQTPWTPGVSALAGLDAALNLVQKEGLQTVFERHAAMAAICRREVRDAGIGLLAAEDVRSPSITAICVPQHWRAPELQRVLLQEHGIRLSTGIGPLQSRIIRLGHMGWATIEAVGDATRTLCRQMAL